VQLKPDDDDDDDDDDDEGDEEDEEEEEEDEGETRGDGSPAAAGVVRRREAARGACHRAVGAVRPVQQVAEGAGRHHQLVAPTQHTARCCCCRRFRF